MTRQQYLAQVIALYLDTPDTPPKARRSDWAVATTFYQQGIPIEDIAHALRLSAMRRIRRDPNLPPLEPICSLAYIRRMVQRLQHRPEDPGYVDYVHWNYLDEMQARRKTAGRRRNPADSSRR